MENKQSKPSPNLKKVDPKSEIGNVYGNHTVIDSTYRMSAKGEELLWICECTCGKITKLRNSVLKDRRACMVCSIHLHWQDKDIKYKNKHHSLKRRLYLTYVDRAKEKNLPFELTLEDAIEIFSQNCHYCGAEPVTGKNFKGNNIDGEFKKNTIDRIDSKLGYVKENVVPCCIMCNKSKLNHPVEVFLDWVNRVYKHISQTVGLSGGTIQNNY
jgi:hypothetical protein